MGEKDLQSGVADTGVSQEVSSDNSSVSGNFDGFDMESALASMSDGLGFAENKVEPAGNTSAAVSEESSIETTEPPAGQVSEEEAAAAAEATTTTTAAAKPAPRTWRPEAAALFANLDPVVQDEILKREEDIHVGLEQYKQDATFGKTMHGAVAPYLPILEQYGIQPERQVADLLRVNYVLALGSPEEKAQMLVNIAKDYDIPLEGLPLPSPDLPPEVKDLQNTVKQLQSTLSASQQQAMQAKRQEIDAIVTKFATDPANIYYKELENDIALLIRSGAAVDLPDAYQKAMWQNPVVREKELARQQAEKTAKEKAIQAEKARKARAATAGNVRSSSQTGRVTAPVGSLDDTLQETLNAIKNR